MNNLEPHPMHASDAPIPLLLKMGMSIIPAAAVAIVAIFFLVLFFLSSGVIYSIAFEPKKLYLDNIEASGMINGLGSLIGATCFIGSYIAPFVLGCVGTLGFPAAFAGWRLGMIRWWTCMLEQIPLWFTTKLG